MRAILFVISLCSFSFASAEESLCQASFDSEISSMSEIMSNKKEIFRWAKYEEFLNKHSVCLEGDAAERVKGLSEDSLAKDWNGFVRFVIKVMPSKKALSEIQSGFAPDIGMPENLKAIQDGARKNCPEQLHGFCRKILKARI